MLPDARLNAACRTFHCRNEQRRGDSGITFEELKKDDTHGQALEKLFYLRHDLPQGEASLACDDGRSEAAR